MAEALKTVAPLLGAPLKNGIYTSNERDRFKALAALARLGLSGAREAFIEEAQSLFYNIRGEVKAHAVLHGQLPKQILLGGYERWLWELFGEFSTRVIRHPSGDVAGYGFDGIAARVAYVKDRGGR
jgi:hypothetical protein